MWWHIALAVVSGLLLVWLVLVVVLWRAMPEETTLRSTLRLIPDVVRLVRRLAGDKTLTRGVRWRLWLLLAYLAMPIDVVPDFIPVLGYADDAIVIALVLRSVVRHAGPEALERHWPGTPEGLGAVLHLAGVAR
ncbi:MAG: YkvA family protein [Nocardioides sp.]